MESLDSIKKYYEYLENVANLSITVHYVTNKYREAFFINALPIPNVHFNPYCTYIKQTLNLHPKCLRCQKKAEAKVISEGSFSGVCHAGVFEYVYPLKFGDNILGFLSVSSYKSENFKETAKKISKEVNADENSIIKFSNVLKSEIPPKEEIDTLIIPLLCMIKNVSAVRTPAHSAVSSLFPIAGIISFCDRYYTKKITIEYLSERFFCSKSFIARTFKKETGKSLPEYVNNLRIKNAMQLLESTNMDIAHIGITVGYDDPSYFTKCFMKVAGVTPKKWRQNKGTVN